MRSLTSSEHACPTSGLLCGRLLVALVESVLRPGGWESMCRYDECHCLCTSYQSCLIRSTVDPLKRYTRHVTLDGLHGALCRHTGRAVRQEELYGERELPEVLTQVSEVRLDAVSSPQV